MSEIEKSEEVVAGEMPAESPLEGTTQSIGDPEAPVDQDALDEQTLASDGVDLPSDEMEDKTEYADVPDPIANEVMEDQSFWSGFFGKPNVPTIG
jgi:hypothetical protein